MRRLMLVALAACGTDPRTTAPEDAAVEDSAPTPDADEDIYNRVINRVLVSDDMVFWSHGQEGCHLENPCRDDGPGMTTLWMETENASVRYAGGIGTRFVSGTKDQLFFVTGSSNFTMYLMRSGIGGDVGMSIPRRDVVGPALDETHVYWAEWWFDSNPPYGEYYTIKRTLRDGDGSVAEDVATVPGLQLHKEAELVHAGGYLWWTGYGVRRVPVTGGPVETFIPGQSATAIVADDDAVYTGIRIENRIEIHRIALDGTVTPLVTDGPTHPWKPLKFMVLAEDRVWWSNEDGNIYNVPQTGGALTTIPVGDDAGRAFVVLPDKLLVSLGFESFRAIWR